MIIIIIIIIIIIDKDISKNQSNIESSQDTRSYTVIKKSGFLFH